MKKCRNKLTKHAKINFLMNKWDIFGASYWLVDLVGPVVSDGIKEKDIYIGLNAKKYLARLYKDAEKEIVPQKGKSKEFQK